MDGNCKIENLCLLRCGIRQEWILNPKYLDWCLFVNLAWQVVFVIVKKHMMKYIIIFCNTLLGKSKCRGVFYGHDFCFSCWNMFLANLGRRWSWSWNFLFWNFFLYLTIIGFFKNLISCLSTIDQKDMVDFFSFLSITNSF